MKTSLTIILLFISSFSSAQWVIQTEGLAIPHAANDICFPSQDTGYLAGWGGKMVKTTNGGNNWTESSPLPSSEILTSVHFRSNTDGYLTATNGTWLKTTDGGNTFVIRQNVGYPGSLHDMTFIDDLTGWCTGGNAGGSNFVSKTTNGGNSWSVQRNFPEYEVPYSIVFVNHDTGFVCMGTNIYRTINGGSTWNIQFTCGKFISSFDFIGKTGFAVGELGAILKTTNTGVNWAVINTFNTNQYLFECSFLNESTGWVVGDTGLILFTTNGGSSFIQEPSGTTKRLTTSYLRDSTIWCAGGLGTSPANSSIILVRKLDWSIQVNLKVLMEGLYYPLFNQMSRKDTVKAYLCETVPPYSKVDSATSTVDSLTFTGLFNFQNASSGAYYIVVKHFQSIETWSKPGGESLYTNGTIFNYNFTSSGSQAYGNNLKLKNGKYCLITGDVFQDGFIDGSDLLIIDNDAYTFATGRFLPSDVNGDGFTDAMDMQITDNNRSRQIIRP